VKITTDLSDDQIAVLVRALDWPPSKTPEELAQAWQQLAVEAWLSWLSGEKRYNSLTEQYTDWIEKIYEHLLPETEAPSVERLWDKFHVPYGQAQYIARVLNNRQMARWREHEREGLKTAMSKRKDEAYRWIEQGDEMEHVEMKLLKPAMKELYIIIEDLFRESPEDVKEMPIRSGSLGNLVAIKITAHLFKKVWERLVIKEEEWTQRSHRQTP
jgi:hypothetical protein